MPTAKAGAQCRVPVPSPPPRHVGRRGRWGQARLVWAGEAGGGRRDWWGQARPMGAASHRPHARARQHRTLGKPPGQIPSQQNERCGYLCRGSPPKWQGSYNSTDDCTLYFFDNLICRSPLKTPRINLYDFPSVFHHRSLPHCLRNLYLADVFFSLEPRKSPRLEKARALR